MKKLVFAAIAMMVMVSASNTFASKSSSAMAGWNTQDTVAPAPADTTKTLPAPADTTKSELEKVESNDMAFLLPGDTVTTDSTATDSTKTPATPAPAKPETV